MLHDYHLSWNIAMPFQQLLIGVIGITNWKTGTQLSCDKGYVNGNNIYDDNVWYSNISWHLGGRKSAVVNPILSLWTSMNRTCDWRELSCIVMCRSVEILLFFGTHRKCIRIHEANNQYRIRDHKATVVEPQRMSLIWNSEGSGSGA